MVYRFAQFRSLLVTALLLIVAAPTQGNSATAEISLNSDSLASAANSTPQKRSKKTSQKKRKNKNASKLDPASTPDSPASAWTTLTDLEIGYQMRIDHKSDELMFHRGFARVKSSTKENSSEPIDLNIEARVFGPHKSKQSSSNGMYELRELSAQKSVKEVAFSFGLQQVSWGETFGPYNITDVVNPTNVYEAADTGPENAKIPLVLAVATWSPAPFTLQLISGPAPRRSPIPRELNGIELLPPDDYTFVENGEYGGRVGTLLPFGLDIKIFTYRHWNRRPAFGLTLVGARPLIILQERQVTTSGASFSQALDSIVIRGDAAYTDRLPVTNLKPSIDQTAVSLAQGVFGLDYTSASGQTSIGGQIQIAKWIQRNPNLEKRYLSWAGIRNSTSFFSEILSVELLFLRGMNNHDTLVEPAVTIKPCCGIDFTVKGFFAFSRDDGDRELLQRQRQIFAQTSWTW